MEPTFEVQSQPVIQVPTLGDIESWRRMQAASWLDTYPNPEQGVSREWVTEQTDAWLTSDALEHSKERVEKILADPEHQFLFVAKVGEESVGMVHTTNINNDQRLEALYVAEKYRGTGIAQQLLTEALSHLDLKQPIVLEVIAYNERAQRFYQKNGFEIVPGSEHFYKEVMPSLKMIRPGDAS